MNPARIVVRSAIVGAATATAVIAVKPHKPKKNASEGRTALWRSGHFKLSPDCKIAAQPTRTTMDPAKIAADVAVMGTAAVAAITAPFAHKGAREKATTIDPAKIAVGAAVVGAAVVGAAAVAAIAVPFAVPFVLSAVGFTSGGVAAASAAAMWQATIGNVAAGSLFASLQSAGAAGLFLMTTVAIAGVAGGIIGGATCAIGYLAVWLWRRK